MAKLPIRSTPLPAYSDRRTPSENLEIRQARINAIVAFFNNRGNECYGPHWDLWSKSGDSGAIYTEEELIAEAKESGWDGSF